MHIRKEGEPFVEGFNVTETEHAIYVYFATKKPWATTPDLYQRIERPIASIGSAISRRVDGDQPTKAPPTEKTTGVAGAYARKNARATSND